MTSGYGDCMCVPNNHLHGCSIHDRKETVTHHHNQFALIQTADGDAMLAVDDISHATAYTADVHPAFADGTPNTGVRVHFKAKGSTYLDLPGISPKGLAAALNGDPF